MQAVLWLRPFINIMLITGWKKPGGLERGMGRGKGDAEVGLIGMVRWCVMWVPLLGWLGMILSILPSIRDRREFFKELQSHVIEFVSRLPSRPKLLPFDHINPSPSHTLAPPPHTAILYADISSPNFRELHNYLLELSSNSNPTVEYVLRYVAGKGEGRKGYLSGYGVFLDLKKMDYLALDDRNSHGGMYITYLLSCWITSVCRYKYSSK